MKPICALAISLATLLAQTDKAELHTVTAVRNWSFADVTRVAIEVSGSFQIRSDRLYNPDRVYFDILNAEPRIDSRRFYSKQLDDKLVKRIRVAETNPGVTRVVLDLAEGVEVTTSQLSNPNRLIIEARGGKGAVTAPETVKTETVKTETVKTETAKTETAKTETVKVEPPPSPLPNQLANAAAKAPARIDLAAVEAPKPFPPPPPESAKVPAVKPEFVAAAPRPQSTPREFGTAARHTSSGQSSLTRALGLKVGRVVIDPGHGGHDQGTQGPKGLVEKDLVLDVALRVGKLIEDHLGAEVIYTRMDDTFIPLEGRTDLANEKKADLFLSIHANSSPYPRISGVETFYLNFTDSKDALDVASRENASSQKSVFELQDIIQRISLHEKLDESKDFAGRIQASLYSLSSRNLAGQKNRGVKKAPFVVLIGAKMPSVLAEIGFVSNPREEALLKKPDYRQKVADALYRGLSKYAESLSHFKVEMAQNESPHGH
ncbi:MAG TPA: N-acetylmuramoyl-L-alanine amidase [Candidatus Solibacter sp.]|nr:N-acetylmuramoyl-L-alanine amidase [Candidatus Solibacter sp.]